MTGAETLRFAVEYEAEKYGLATSRNVNRSNGLTHVRIQDATGRFGFDVYVTPDGELSMDAKDNIVTFDAIFERIHWTAFDSALQLSIDNVK